MNNNFTHNSADVIIVAAGSGNRLGASIPKAFVPLCGKPMLSFAFDIFRSHPAIGKVIIVVPSSMAAVVQRMFPHNDVAVTIGGKERWESVSNGLKESDAQWVLVHDAARPFVTHKIIDDVLALRSSFECGITATPEVDTIRTFIGNQATATVDRSTLIRVGTPQLFKRELLLDYIGSALTLDQAPTDEAMLFQAHGKPVGFSWGDPKNFKITTPEDLEIAEALCAKKTMHLGG
jgi:2-C-methyl-D-erythritol 4-phosphate cytidylyltransferase